MRRLGIADCRRAAQVYFKVPRAEILGRSQEHCIAHPRQVAIALARELVGSSWKQIAGVFDRDHSTAVHGAAAVRDRCERSLGYAMTYEALRLPLAVYAAQLAIWEDEGR